MRKEEFTVGRLIRAGSSNGAVTVLETDENGYVTLCKCATGSIPSAVAGYAVGCLLIDTTTGKLYQNDSATSCTFNSIGDIASAEIAANAITPIKMGIRTLVALADAAATPTIAQLMTSSIFTITPTTARTFTTPTAALIVAGITGATIGSWFDFTIVNLAAFAVTVTAGAGVTLSGSPVVNKGAATFRAVLTNVTAAAEALTIYRTDSAVITEQIPLTNGSVIIGDANGLGSQVTPDTAGLVTKAGAQTIAGDKTFSGTIIRALQQRVINTGAKIGATAGWTLGGGAVNAGLTATLPASQTASTLVIPIPGLKVGDTITAFSVVGQIESAGATATLDADLRKLTAAAADVVDASVGAITQVSVTADAIVSASKSSLTEVVAADETFYVLLTGTTAALTDIALQGITITVTES